MWNWFGYLLILGIVFAGSSPAHADKRVALVIGNAAYQHTRVLPNPRNDAEAIAMVLRGIGFEVTVKTDQGYGDMRHTIRDFGQSANGADIAVIHFAGHGLELAGENYLLPVDAKVARDGDLEYEAVTLTSLLATVRGATKLRLVILDACRNNPLGDRMALSAGATRAVSRGLARIEPSGDVLVAYSAKHGTLAQDGDGPLSPYAEALVKHLATPGVDIRLVMGRVRDMVLERTARAQEPFVYGSIGGEMLALVPGKSTDALAPPPPPLPNMSEAAREWLNLDKTSAAELETFIGRHGASSESVYAAARLKELRQQRSSATALAAPHRPQIPALEEDTRRPPADSEAKACNLAGRRAIFSYVSCLAPGACSPEVTDSITFDGARLTRHYSATNEDGQTYKIGETIDALAVKEIPPVNKSGGVTVKTFKSLRTASRSGDRFTLTDESSASNSLDRGNVHESSFSITIEIRDCKTCRVASYAGKTFENGRVRYGNISLGKQSCRLD